MFGGLLPTRRARWAIVICVSALHPVILYFGLPVFGEACNLIVFLTPVVATLMFSWKAGVLFTFVGVFVSAGMFSQLVGMGATEG